MSTIRLRDGRLILETEEGPLALPPTLSPAFLEAMFSDDEPLSPTHIAMIHERLSQADKDRFEQACRTAGEPYETMWSKACIAWASIGTLDGKWDLSAAKICFKTHIGSYLVSDIMLTESGIWYVDTVRGIKTLPEFEAMWNITIEQHLDDYLNQRKICCDQIRTVLNGNMRWVEVTLALPDGTITSDKRRGPADVPVKEWRFRPGETFVATTDPGTE